MASSSLSDAVSTIERDAAEVAGSPSPRNTPPIAKCETPSTTECLGMSRTEGSNRLDAMTRDVLVNIFCRVNYSDLKQLLLVSKTLSEAALIAKEMHFNYITPLSRPAWKAARDGDADSSGKAPNAPMQHRVIARSRFDVVKLSRIAVVLFTSDDES